MKRIVENLNSGNFEKQEEAVFEAHKLVEKHKDQDKDMTRFLPLIDALLPLLGHGGIAGKMSRGAYDIIILIGPLALPKIQLLLNSSEEKLRFTAVGLLTDLRKDYPDIVDDLIVMLNDKSLYVQQVVCRNLKIIGKDAVKAVPILEAKIAAIHGKSERESELEIDILVTLFQITGQEKTLKQLIQLLGHTSSSIRGLIVSQLGEIGLPARSSWKALLHILENDPDPLVRHSSVYTLGKIGSDDEKTITALSKILKLKEDNETKRSAVVTLGLIGAKAKGTLSLLDKILQDADNKSQAKGTNSSTGWWIAAEAVAKIAGDKPEGREILQKALKSHDPDIRRQAKRALDVKPKN